MGFVANGRSVLEPTGPSANISAKRVTGRVGAGVGPEGQAADHECCDDQSHDRDRALPDLDRRNSTLIGWRTGRCVERPFYRQPHVASRLNTLCGIFVKATPQVGVQPTRNCRGKRFSLRLSLKHGRQRQRDILSFKGSSPREHLKQDRTKRPDSGPRHCQVHGAGDSVGG